jgi:multiple sugar transport system ATP-binding protein
MAKSDIDTAVREIARVLRITDLLDKKPSALSGGDMQRVAIGRALVRRPKAMLMDEPIGALDAKLREEMRAEIKRLHVKQGSTTIYVTHDQIEAMSLADRIVIMHEGVLQQVGTPEEVYQRPANLFVAQFVGSPVMNVAETRVAEQGGQASVSVGGVERGFAFPHELLSKLNGHAAGGLALGIRPEGVLVRHEKADGYLPVEARIIEPLGSFDIVDLRVGDEVLRARTKSGFVPGPGKQVFARLDPAQAHFFDTASGKSLGVKL